MFRSERYLAFVRDNPCIALGCSEPAKFSHHFSKRHGEGGEALKPHDTFTVPLCFEHHELIHQTGLLPMLSKAETDAVCFREALKLVTRWWLMRKERKAA